MSIVLYIYEHEMHRSYLEAFALGMTSVRISKVVFVRIQVISKNLEFCVLKTNAETNRRPVGPCVVCGEAPHPSLPLPIR